MARLLLLACLAASAFSMTVAVPTAGPTDAPDAAPTTVNPLCQPACPNKKAGRVPNLCRCQSYFECDKKGAATIKLCKPWQNFDPKALECKFWDAVDCTWLTPTTAAPTTTTTTQAPPVDGCDWRPQCPATGSSKQGIPCKDSCGSYIQCQDGAWTKKSCPFYQHNFDTKSNKCVMWGAKCAA